MRSDLNSDLSTARSTAPGDVETRTAGTEPAPAVEWEPCPEFAADAAEPGVCAGCGWLEDDHTVDVPRAA